MLKTNLVLVLAIFFSLGVHAQGEYNKCYFGTAAVDFGNLYPSVLTNSAMEASESAASICDEQGNLLFYSNGGNSPTIPGVEGAVWNANHEIMENGILSDSSGCISSYHGAVAFPSPASTKQNKTGESNYYLFLRDCVESSFSAPNYNSGLTYCIIDMNENGGLGKVVEKNQVAVPFSEGSWIKTSHEPVAAVKNANNQDWWIFSYNNDSLYRIELTENGIGNYQSYGISEGAITISPRRDKLIAGDKLYDLNASTGELNYLMSFNIKSASFSSDGTKLYRLSGGKLFQYDVDANDILNSEVEIATVSNIHALYLAPDTRIYLFGSNANNIPGYIECPNNNGFNTGITMSGLSLNGRSSGDFFTNIPANYLYKTTNQCNVSVEEIEKNQQKLTISPNPAKNEIKILSSTMMKINDVKIFSSTGRLMIHKSKVTDSTIDISNLSSGVYFVHSMLKDEVVVTKLVVE